MRTSFFFVFRLVFAWVAMFLTLLIVWSASELNTHEGPPWFIMVAVAINILFVITSAFSHLRRVRLIAGQVDSSKLANRQRRQIEIPFEAGEAFDLLEAAIRELPRTVAIESARDSLQIRAKVERLDPYENNWLMDRPPFKWFRNSTRDQILATIKPDDSAGSVTLICEPEGGAWRDWFLVDDGANLENAEAITRAISRRVAARRRGEQATVTQSVTEKELTVAKLNLLHAQVEPHFLYNTLASAQYLTRSDPARADEMLGNLIVYLRHSLPRIDDTRATLGDELDRARAYLDILKIRMGSRLALQIDVPDTLKAHPFPAMMMQTLVENAIKHGLEPKTGGGTIWILARMQDNKMLSVTVADDGCGISADAAGTGIGLKNIRERLRLAYGAKATFSITANFPTGAAATIVLPIDQSESVAHA